MKKRIRVLPVIILTALMVLLMTACSFQKAFNKGQPFNNALSCDELARIVTLAVQKPDSVASCFSSIPAPQLDSVSYSAFSEYTNILREIIRGKGDVVAFKPLNDSEKASLDEEIIKTCGINMNDMYPNQKLIEIICDGDSEQNVYFPVKIGDIVTLDGKAIADTIASYNYIFHYMDMVYSSNTSALVSILAPMYSDDIYIESVIRAKAEFVIDYYSNYVRSGYDDISISLAMPCLVRLTLPRVDNGKGDLVAKEVNLISRYGSYYVDDKMPLNPSGNMAYLYKNDVKVFTVGQELDQTKVEEKLGKPLYTVNKVDYSSGPRRIVMCYKGLNLAFDAVFDEGGKWRGSLVSIRIFGQGEYSLDKSCYVGMNISELMLVYPFIDEYDFDYAYENENGARTVSFQRDEAGNIITVIMK